MWKQKDNMNTPTISRRIGTTSNESAFSLIYKLRELKKQLLEAVDKKLGKVDEKIAELDSKVSQIKELYKGDNGKDADEQKIIDALNSKLENFVYEQVIPEIRQPKDGVSPDPKQITKEVLSLLPKIDEERIIKQVIKRSPKPSLKVITEKIDEESIINNLLKSDKIKVKFDGLDAQLKVLDRRYIHGGGDTVSAGTGVTITNVNGTKQISASSSGFTTVNIATGTIDDTTTVFTFSSAISAVCVNGSIYRNGSTAMGGTIIISGVTATLPNPIGTGGDLFGIA